MVKFAVINTKRDVYASSATKFKATTEEKSLRNCRSVQLSSWLDSRGELSRRRSV